MRLGNKVSPHQSDFGGTCSGGILMKRAAIAFVLLYSVLARASISATEAKNHVGEDTTVCGTVASAHYAATSRGKPTFINLDAPYPNQIFTILIWGTDRTKFGHPEQTYSGKRVCVTGTITLYRGIPETEASEPSQIEVR
jgi:DNA/RNA endonuclease YhcR with UshA esterase domain